MKPPDVRAIVLDYLAARVAVPVVATRPDDGKAKSFVRVLATGGPGRHDRILQTVQLTVDCYATSTGRAYDLAAAVDDAMHALPAARVEVAHVPWATTPQDYPDPDTGSPRFTATYQVVVKVR